MPGDKIYRKRVRTAKKHIEGLEYFYGLFDKLKERDKPLIDKINELKSALIESTEKYKELSFQYNQVYAQIDVNKKYMEEVRKENEQLKSTLENISNEYNKVKEKTFNFPEFIEARKIFENFEIPDKLYDNVVLTKVGEKYTFTDVNKLDSDVEQVRNLDRNQQGYIFDIISERISKHYENSVRYRLLPLQKSFDLVHAKTSEGKKFKEHVMQPGWIHNLERFKQSGITSLFKDSNTYPTENGFAYEGDPVPVKIIGGNVFDTLKKVKVFNNKTVKVYNGGFYFENGESSVRSLWLAGVGCFGAYAFRPSGRNSLGRAVAEKTDERVVRDNIGDLSDLEL